MAKIWETFFTPKTPNSEPPSEPPIDDQATRISRRDFLIKAAKIGAGAGVVAGGIALGVNAIRKKEVSTEPEPAAEPNRPAPIKNSEHKEAAKPALAEHWQILQNKYPQLKKQPENIFVEANDDYYEFLGRCQTIGELQSLGLFTDITEKQLRLYINNQAVWEGLTERKNDGLAWKKLGKKVLSAPPENLSWPQLIPKISGSIAECQTAVGEQGLPTNKFSSLLDADVLLAIFIQEIAPAKISVNRRVVTLGHRQRIEIFRILINEGWQITHTPARDVQLSYGLPQTIAQTHDALFGLYKKTGLLEKDFSAQHTLAAQTKEAFLLAYDNLRAFNKIAQEKKHFAAVWAQTPSGPQKRFLTTVLAAFHNYGNRTKLRNLLDAALSTPCKSLEDWRRHLLRMMGRVPDVARIAAPHAHNSSVLFAHLEKLTTKR